MQKEEFYIRLPLSVLMDERLSRAAVLLYAVLIAEANEYGILYMRIATMAYRCKLSERTVRRAEAQLVDAGYIEVWRTGRESMITISDMRLRPAPLDTFAAYRAAEQKEDAV